MDSSDWSRNEVFERFRNYTGIKLKYGIGCRTSWVIWLSLWVELQVFVVRIDEIEKSLCLEIGKYN